LAEHWNSRRYATASRQTCPHIPQAPTGEPAALGTCLKASLKPLGVVTRVVMAVQPSRSPTVERLEHFLLSLPLPPESLPAGRGASLKPEDIVAVDLKHVVEQETHVFQRAL